MIYNPSKSLRNRSMVLRQHTSKGHDLAEAVTWRGATHKSLLKSLLQEMWLADSLPVMPWNTPQKPSSGYSAPVPEHWGTVHSPTRAISVGSLSCRTLYQGDWSTLRSTRKPFLSTSSFSLFCSQKRLPTWRPPLSLLHFPQQLFFFFCTSYSILVSTSQRT